MGAVLLVLFAYAFGSLLFGEMLAKLKGVDLRSAGSGNVGATNVSRVLGKKYGVLVFFLDMLKGFIPTALAVSLYSVDSWVVFFVGVASVLGHTFSVFSGFSGGKGVATAFGVLVAISLKTAVFVLLIWAVVLRWKGYVSLASIVSVSVTPLIMLVFGFPASSVFTAVLVAGVVVFKHKPNIERLLRGEELKL